MYEVELIDEHGRTKLIASIPAPQLIWPAVAPHAHLAYQPVAGNLVNQRVASAGPDAVPSCLK